MPQFDRSAKFRMGCQSGLINRVQLSLSRSMWQPHLMTTLCLNQHQLFNQLCCSKPKVLTVKIKHQSLFGPLIFRLVSSFFNSAARHEWWGWINMPFIYITCRVCLGSIYIWEVLSPPNFPGFCSVNLNKFCPLSDTLINKKPPPPGFTAKTEA